MSYEPSPQLLRWFQDHEFVRVSDSWEKAWDHSSGYESVAIHFFPWDGKGGFSGESYSVSVRNHASGTNPTVTLGVAHDIWAIWSLYNELSALNYDAHTTWWRRRSGADDGRAR